MNKLKKIFIISGPTAVGKSGLALKIGEKFDIAIINADAIQMYKGLPILSAQPNNNDQKITHYLYSHFSANDEASVAIWLDLIENFVNKTINLNKIPIIVGGSGMYISRLIDGISNIPNIDASTKEESEKMYEEIGHYEFQKKFGDGKIFDKQKLLRASQVFIQTGKPISFWHQQDNKKIFPDDKIIHVNLNIDRNDLYQNCDSRFLNMIKLGAIDEVKNLIKNYPNVQNKPIANTLGFKEIVSFLNNEISIDDATKIATKKTRNYAKRQLTWFRNQFKNKFEFSKIDDAYDFISKEILD